MIDLTPRRGHHRPAVVGLMLIWTSLTGCQSAPASPAAVPASLLAPSETCLQTIAAFAQTTTGRTTQLTPLAFKDSSVLMLERAAHKDSQGRLLDGMDRGRPEIFQLSRSASGQCTVTHPSSGQTQVLAACHCETQAPAP